KDAMSSIWIHVARVARLGARRSQTRKLSVFTLGLDDYAARSRSTSLTRLCSSTRTITGLCVSSSASVYAEYAQMISRSPTVALRAAAPFNEISPEPFGASMMYVVKRSPFETL